MLKKENTTTRFSTSTKAKRSVKRMKLLQPLPPLFRIGYMRVPIIVSCLCLLIPFSGATQNIKKRLKKGIEAHQMYDLITCDTVLSSVLEKKELLDDADLGEGMYFFTRNLFRMTVDEAEGALGYHNMNTQLKFYRAYNSFLELERLDISRWSSKARPEIELMFPALLTGTVKCLDVYVDQGEDKSSELREIIKGYISLATSILPENYAPYELRGQLFYIDGDKENAAENFDIALDKYRSRRVLMLDNIRMANVYFQRALMYLEKGKVDKAYKLAKEGYWRNDIEWKTMGINVKKFEPGRVKEQEPLYFNNQYNLGLLELELMVQTDPTNDSTLILYAEREVYYGEEFSFHYNYAGLLEQVNPRKASMHYQKAIDLDSSSFDAHFQMAKLYIDLGFYFIDSNKGKTKEAEDARARGKQMLEIGFPYLKTANELSPANISTLAVLVEVCAELGLNEEQAEYKSTLDSIQKP